MKRAATAALVLVVASCSQGAEPAGAGSGSAPSAAGDSTIVTTSNTDAPTAGGVTCWSSNAQAGEPGIAFVDITEPAGLVQPLTGMRGHAAAWGDVDGDLKVDLFVGTFAMGRTEAYAHRGATGPSPDRLLIGGDTAFTTSAQFPEAYGRTSGAVFADLDGDGDLDLVASRNAGGRDAGEPTDILENTGGGFVVAASGIASDLGARSVGVLDVNGDQLLDLIVVEDRYRGGSSRLYRNLGGLQFEDASEALGLGTGVDGLGIATSDLNNDGHTDVFIAGSNRLFTGTGSGLVEVPGAVPPWEVFGNEDDVSGAAIADVNRDGWLDLVVGHHYNSTLSQGRAVPVRLYLNRTATPGGTPVLEDVTEAAGLIGLPTKAPHVDLADLDNDGWVDVITTASAGEGGTPAIFRNLGIGDGTPTFEAPVGLGAEQYWVSGPTADVDRDGRLDLLLVEWEPRLPSLLLRNDSASGHWLEVSVGPELGGGIGTRVDVYEPGGAGDAARLIGSRDIVASLGYTAGVQQSAHFGLGEATQVDVVIRPPAPHAPITLAAVGGDRHIRLPNGCGG